MRYRPHKGSLEVSVACTCDFETRAELIALLRRELAPWPTMFITFTDDQVRVQPYYGDDDRIGWKDVHIVTIDGYGVMGFCEGPAA